MKVDEGMKVDPLQPSLKADLEEAKARVVEKEAHFEEVVEEYTPTVQAKKCPTPSKPPPAPRPCRESPGNTPESRMAGINCLIGQPCRRQ